jgi:UDP-N-acetylglucosamine 4,6-dehydratase
MRVLVTGGSGTFGTAYVGYALAHGASRVTVLSRGEHRQAELLRRFNYDQRLECWIGDVRDADRLAWAFRCRPDVVIHAAAMKRVEVCEANSDEARATNVDGTANVVKAAMLADVPKVLVLSSDKATSPETVYGSTKSMAEAIALGQNAYRGTGRTRISAVRYGNVIGSQGSFLEVLQRCRDTGDPVPITDARATRFWWSIEEAVAFVDRVLARMRGAEIWIPKIAAASVVDLARLVAPRSSHRVIGTRGPEKLHEAMINATESSYAYEMPDCYLLLPKRGAWWSPGPPQSAIPVPDGFSYASNTSLHPEALEALSCYASAS